MRALFPSAVVVFVALATASARADGLIHKLPEDGTWALYKMEGYEERSGEKKPATGHVQIASVGKETVGDEKCRWIEIEIVSKNVNEPEAERKRVIKVLIPEKYLTKGQGPAEHILRGWVADAPRPPRRIPEHDGRVYSDLIALLLPGPAVEAEELEPAEVDSGLGKLTAAGVKGEYRPQVYHRDGPAELPIQFEQRLHDKAPFGVLRYEFTYAESGGPGKVTKVTLTLTDVGDVAISQLLGAN